MLKKTIIVTSLLFAAACASDEPETTDDATMMPEETTSVATPAAEMARATANLTDSLGASVGTATLEEREAGVRIALQLTGLPEGPHGFHVHMVGDCTAPTFESAGGHFNPTNRQHGLENSQGPHAGDMENFDVAGDGTANFATDNDRITLSPGANSVLDADGSALVVHAMADDNMTDPSGNSGARIACGVITES